MTDDLLKWKSEYEIGDAEIDAQHRWLFQTAESIRDAGPEVEKKVVEDLHRYTRIHFKKEEQLMGKISYPKLSQHQRLHQKLIEKLRYLRMVRQFRRGGLEPLVQLMMAWIRNHILEHDMKLAHYIRKRDLAGGR